MRRSGKLATHYSAIAQLVTLPEPSWEGRTIHAVKIGSGGGDRRAVLFIVGVHARELINPDLLVSLALKLCQAYTNGTGLTFGDRSYDASIVKLIVEQLDVILLPLVNSDGRVHVQAPGGEPMWRKNRNPGLPCRGVDLNRNYDFLWPSGIGTSSDSCTDVFKGSTAFSEPETRNVRHLLDQYPNVECMADVHSYMQLILHPWGDDTSQTTDPSMSFQNPAFNGLRGNPADTVYSEYIPAAAGTGWSERASRCEMPSRRCGGRPMWSNLCILTLTTTSVLTERQLDDLRRLRDDVLATSPTGQRNATLLTELDEELFELLADDPKLADRVRELMAAVHRTVIEPDDRRIPKERVDELDTLAKKILRGKTAHGAVSDRFAAAIKQARRDLRHFGGRTLQEDLAAADAARGG